MIAPRFLPFYPALGSGSCLIACAINQRLGRESITSSWTIVCATCTRSIIISLCSSRWGFVMFPARFIFFHPGSARIEKFWDPARWAEVIDHAGRNSDIDLVLTGGASPLEQTHIAEIKTKTRHQLVDLSGKTDLLTLTALIAQARLLVAVDSAPMHLAAAIQTPQVVLFGPTNPFHWRPRESPALILQGESRTPLTKFLPVQARLPMSQISTEAVINAMDSLLSSPATVTS